MSAIMGERGEALHRSAKYLFVINLVESKEGGVKYETSGVQKFLKWYGGVSRNQFLSFL